MTQEEQQPPATPESSSFDRNIREEKNDLFVGDVTVTIQSKCVCPPNHPFGSIVGLQAVDRNTTQWIERRSKNNTRPSVTSM